MQPEKALLEEHRKEAQAFTQAAQAYMPLRKMSIHLDARCGMSMSPAEHPVSQVITR